MWWLGWFGCPSSPPPAGPEEPAAAEVVAEAPPPVDLSPSNDGFVLANRLREADEAALDPSASDARVAELGHAQQRVLRQLADDPVLAHRTLQAFTGPGGERAHHLLDATRAMGRTARPQTDLPAWRVVAPKPAAELRDAYVAASAEHGVPWTVLAAIHLHETRLGRLRGVSPAGAQGPMQFMPETWARYGKGDVNDDRDAIAAAARYLAASGWAKDPRKAVWAYNHSPDYVASVLDTAAVLDAEPAMFRALWGWQVYYRTVQGPIWLEEGYTSDARQPIAAWCEGRDAVRCPPSH